MQGSWEFQSPSSGSWVPFTAPNNKRISQAAESGARVNRLFVSPLFSHLPLALWPYSRELSYYCDILRVNMPSSECAQRDETLNQCLERIETNSKRFGSNVADVGALGQANRLCICQIESSSTCGH